MGHFQRYGWDICTQTKSKMYKYNSFLEYFQFVMHILILHHEGNRKWKERKKLKRFGPQKSDKNVCVMDGTKSKSFS